MAHGSAVARNVPRLGLEADEVAPRAALLDLRQRLAADEVPFSKLDRPAKSRFVRVDRFVHVVSVKAQRGLESRRVARAKACREDAIALALGEDRVPHIADASG